MQTIVADYLDKDLWWPALKWARRNAIQTMWSSQGNWLFFACSLNRHKDTWIGWHLKETVLWGSITWLLYNKRKQNIKAIKASLLFYLGSGGQVVFLELGRRRTNLCPKHEALASFPVVLGDFECDVTCQACRENSPRTPSPSPHLTYHAWFQASSGNSDSSNWPGYKADEASMKKPLAQDAI